MDIRGIEVTNQLRSAIRAKLLELGVRYDEELPDYILVMVVNKKSRLQMHEDLHLFLEDNTTLFVDWLHDQVLKKLQKVTVAKKKTARELVPSVIVKQEEERKKRKNATSFLEDQTPAEVAEKLLGKTLKEDKQPEEEIITKTESSQECTSTSEKCPNESHLEIEQEDHSKKAPLSSNDQKGSDVKEPVVLLDQSSSECNQSITRSETVEPEKETLEKIHEIVKNHKIDQNVEHGKRTKKSNEDDLSDSSCKKRKSSIVKPKITSVVSIKNRLGIASPRKKFEVHREKEALDNKHRSTEVCHFESANHKHNFLRLKNVDTKDNSRSRDTDIKVRGLEKPADIKNRIGSSRDDKSNSNIEIKEKLEIIEKPVFNIKDRLGTCSNSRMQKQSMTEVHQSKRERNLPALEKERNNFRGKNVKYRLGPMKKKSRVSQLHVLTEDDDDDQSVINFGPIKSHIVAVQKPVPENTNRKRLSSNDKQISDAEDEGFEGCKIPSKVIVTPRPLKPLQPTQKRATQSLLLRAIAEANQSVVRQKKPDPSLMETKPLPKRSKPSVSWETGQNLSVHLDAKKRFVMEKIQVELTTVKNSNTKPYGSNEVTDEHIGVVRSLFQQSNNNQKFLVTLNGYNNNILKEENSHDDEEGLKMEVQECDELEVSLNDSDVDQLNESESTTVHISNAVECSNEDSDSEDSKESNNDENQNIENVDIIEEPPKATRKLSPIIFNRSRSSTPELKSKKFSTISIRTQADEKLKVDSTSTAIGEEPKEKCRYWPNCTLGKKCAYYHPPISCSAFPACKFGRSCTYLHPKCKFGSTCTKVGCIFSHMSQKCKYHPYCTKSSCPYDHPLARATLPTTQRAKFTWRRRN